ncbi:efflux transporter periplasmic adaptor subunit [Photorhabdus temperata]|uniref:RND family efflux transporter, MFP subunit n=1 Tax=Photorhabdus khanii NC19 TaxID=1004151 RepID=W3V382_9GAMM|nr:efflux RND transporter periplasmic adaptor subunit [Photorhabdus khanii]ETS30396.1 RND family efflux transporter, MFP subunit [Photorhabdus khanii NC19]OHV59176.1 efflux transporter periplasmic adaptor subunit [Photorhabdus temperata]
MLVKKKKWVVIITVMIVFLAVIYNKFNRQETPVVMTEQIITGTLGNVITMVGAAGVIQPTSQVNVGSQISGQLIQLHVEVGDVVEAGKLVASIDDTFYRTKVEASRARLEKLCAMLKEEQYTYELLSITEKRQRQLNLRSATSQQLLDEATFGVKKSQARIESLKADIRQNEHILHNEEVSLSYAQIYSPIAGVVTAIHVDPGQTLNVNQQTPVLMQIADLKNMTVYAKVSEADINQIALGQKASFRIYGANKHIWHGNVKKIMYKPDLMNNAVYYTVLFDVPNDNFLLKPSMSADVTIVTHESSGVVTIPSDVLNNKRHQPLDDNLTAYFLREMKDGNIVVRKLLVGHNDGVRSVVTSGLQNNEQIVVLAKQDNAGGKNDNAK